MNSTKLRSQSSTSLVHDPRKLFDSRASRHSRTRTDPQESHATGAGGDVVEVSTGVADNSGTSDTQVHPARPSGAASNNDENYPSRSSAGRSTRQEGSPAPTKPSPPHAKTRGGSSHPWPLDGRGLRCKVKGCRESPSYSFDGRRPAVRCGNHRETKMYRVEHIDKKKCGEEGCTRPAQVSYMSQNGRIGRFCSEHRKQEAIVTTRKTTCQYGECGNEPRYGARKGPLSFCCDHKRIGMYTNRNGQLMVATRDGSAFQLRRQSRQTIEATQEAMMSDDDSLPESNGENVGILSSIGESSQGSAANGVAAIDDSPKQMARKLCEVPGCEVQPSYGIKGTRKAIFCTNHKGPGMVALKNRPCAFIGCDTRPHYGVSGGRPVYCARHRKRGMVHILKQQSSLQKEAATRKRAEAKKKKSAQNITPEKPEEAAVDIRPLQLPADDKNEEGGQRCGKEDRKVAGAPVASTGKTGKDGGKREKACSVPSCLPCSSSLPSSSRSNSTPAPRQRASSPTAEEPAAACSSTNAGRKSPISLTAGTFAGPPSAEVCTLKAATESARESVRAAASASGSGRRPRAPSLKALEASGMTTGEGAQLMTKEMKEEQARKMREYKEQRRAFAAARLEAKKLLGGTSNGSLGRSAGVGAAKEKEYSRKLFSREMSPQPELKLDEKPLKSVKEKEARKMSGTGAKVIDGAVGNSGVAKGSGAEQTDNLSKDDAVTRETTGTMQGQFAAHKRARTTSMGNHGRGDGENEHGKKHKSNESTGGKAKRRRTAAGATAATISCLAENCSRVATHGISNTLRFCKEHALFGMYEIDNNG